MADETVTPMRRRATPKPLLLTATPDETVHRVACVLKYLVAHPRDTNLAWTEDEEFGRHILLSDLSAALDNAYSLDYGRKEVSHG